MAGVNLSEENARILATNSELVGTQTRSCQDEAVLNTAVLQKRMSQIGDRRFNSAPETILTPNIDKHPRNRNFVTLP